jgi:hypothetical protein
MWRYLWRTTPMHRTEEVVGPDGTSPPPLPPGLDDAEVQRARDGAGPMFHRRYRTRIREAEVGAEELIERLSCGLDWAAPTEFASFQKTAGDPSAMHVGDEYVVRMAGPWDGPVRVVEKGPSHFRLATLHDHLEAGQIEFRAREEDGLIVFEIESWARSANRVVHVLYDLLRISKETQLHMWVSTLEGVARMAGGRMTRGIDIHTRRVAA